jgi:hypothetical protein
VKSLDQHQSRTDLLGTLDVAQQELGLLPRGSNPRLIDASDFLEDDGTYRFVSARELADSVRARQLAVKLREQHGFAMQGVSLCLGRLESNDFARLSAARKDAVEAFWAAYLTTGGEPARIQFDGTGVLTNTLRGCAWGKR